MFLPPSLVGGRNRTCFRTENIRSKRTTCPSCSVTSSATLARDSGFTSDRWMLLPLLVCERRIWTVEPEHAWHDMRWATKLFLILILSVEDSDHGRLLNQPSNALSKCRSSSLALCNITTSHEMEIVKVTMPLVGQH